RGAMRAAGGAGAPVGVAEPDPARSARPRSRLPLRRFHRHALRRRSAMGAGTSGRADAGRLSQSVECLSMCAPSNAPRDVVHYVTTGLGMPVRWSQPRGALSGCLKHGRLGSAWIRGDAGAVGAAGLLGPGEDHEAQLGPVLDRPAEAL